MRDVELPLVAVLRAMERPGIALDLERLAAITARVREEVATLERSIHTSAGEEFLIGSPQQLGAILFDKLPLSRKRRGKTGFSTDARVLQRSARNTRSCPDRALARAVDAGQDRPRAAARPGRRALATPHHLPPDGGGDGPPVVDQPEPAERPDPHAARPRDQRLLRRRDGCVLIAADYSQIELRILAQLADEPVLKEIFVRGEDVHTATACQVFGVEPRRLDAGMRSKAKMINYGIVYGLSDFGLADRLQSRARRPPCSSPTSSSRFPAVRAFIDGDDRAGQEQGYVKTLLGRRRQIPELRARNRQQHALGERLAVNTVIQGTAADIIKLAMVRCHAALAESGLKTRLILTIHDELLFEGPREEADAATELVRREMVGVWTYDPPMAVDIGAGADWLSAK